LHLPLLLLLPPFSSTYSPCRLLSLKVLKMEVFPYASFRNCVSGSVTFRLLSLLFLSLCSYIPTLPENLGIRGLREIVQETTRVETLKPWLQHMSSPRHASMPYMMTCSFNSCASKNCTRSAFLSVSFISPEGPHQQDPPLSHSLCPTHTLQQWRGASSAGGFHRLT
jgi:hypothetical protein